MPKVPLSRIAHGRSGDKGNHANVAVIAYTDAGFAWLREHLTAEVVAAYFAPLEPSRVERFEAANVRGLNFMLYDVLAGGASQSLRIDTQGKTLRPALLRMTVEVPANWRTATRRRAEFANAKTRRAYAWPFAWRAKMSVSCSIPIADRPRCSPSTVPTGATRDRAG